MRSSLYRRRGSDSEREPLLAAIPASGLGHSFRDEVLFPSFFKY